MNFRLILGTFPLYTILYTILPTTIHYNDFMQSTTAFIKINIISLIQILLHKYTLWWHHHCFLNADDSALGQWSNKHLAPLFNRNHQKSQRQTKLFNSVQNLTKSSTWPAGVDNHFFGNIKIFRKKTTRSIFINKCTQKRLLMSVLIHELISWMNTQGTIKVYHSNIQWREIQPFFWQFMM